MPRITRRFRLLFSGCTLLAVGVVAALAFIVHYETLRMRAEEDAAFAVTSTLRPVLAREESDPAAFTESANRLLSGQVHAIRLWSADGRLLATAAQGEAAAAELDGVARAAEGNLASHKADSPQGDLLASYAALGPDTVLEIQQDYGPLAQSIAVSRRVLLITVVGAAAVLLLFLQGALWTTTRGLKREHERLLHISGAGRALRSTLDLPDVLELLARDTARGARARFSFVTLVEDDGDDLILQASFDALEETAAHHHRKVEEWFLRRCAATGETVSAQQDRFPYRALLGYEPEEQLPVSILSAAIPGRERAIGVITVVRDREAGSSKASEVQMLEEMAAQAAIAVEQAVLFAKMRRYASEVELSYDTTLKALMAALDAKDSGTQGHSERVSRLTVTVAKELGVPDGRLVDIERGALLHDIGKIGVPDDVLRAPSALTEGEWEAMQQHPLLAGLMISKVEFLEGALPILLYHHERYDGSGYPFGLHGEAIPLEARIFAVVDAYDAMTSDRPYRKAMPLEAALEEIRENAGIQFDPLVVEAFMRVIARPQPEAQQAA